MQGSGRVPLSRSNSLQQCCNRTLYPSQAATCLLLLLCTCIVDGQARQALPPFQIDHRLEIRRRRQPYNAKGKRGPGSRPSAGSLLRLRLCPLSGRKAGRDIVDYTLRFFQRPFTRLFYGSHYQTQTEKKLKLLDD